MASNDNNAGNFQKYFGGENLEGVAKAIGPALTKFWSKASDQKVDDDRTSSSLENGTPNGRASEVNQTLIVDTLGAIDDRLKTQGIVLASSLEQQTATVRLLQSLTAQGARGGSGGGAGTVGGAGGPLAEGAATVLGGQAILNFIKTKGATVLGGLAPFIAPELAIGAVGAVAGYGAYKATQMDPTAATDAAAAEAGLDPSNPAGSADIGQPKKFDRSGNDAKIKDLNDSLARIEQHLKLSVASDEERLKLTKNELAIKLKILELEKETAAVLAGNHGPHGVVGPANVPTQIAKANPDGTPPVRDGNSTAPDSLSPIDQLKAGIIGRDKDGKPIYAHTAGGGGGGGGAHTAGAGGSRSDKAGLNKGDNNLEKNVDSKEATDAGFTPKQWDAYRLGVTDLESKGKGYDISGGAGGGYQGKYQMGHTEIAETAKRLGVDTPTDEQFRKNPKMQEKFFENYTMDHYNSMMKDPEFAKLSKEDQLKYLAVGHNQGVGNSIKDIGSAHIVGALATLHGKGWGHDAWGTKSDRYYNSVGARLADSGELKAMGNASYGSEVGKGVGLNANNNQDDDKIEQYMKEAGVPINARNFAWCAAWVNAQLRHEGVVGSGSQLANSFAAWGRGESGDQAKRGDVMELKNGSHVGRYTGKSRMGKNGIEYEMYAGNAGNADHAHGQYGSVKESWYSGNDINFRGLPDKPKGDNGLISVPKPSKNTYRPEDSKNASLDANNEAMRHAALDDYSEKQHKRLKDNQPTLDSRLVKQSNDAAKADAQAQARQQQAMNMVVNHHVTNSGPHPRNESSRMSSKEIGSANPPSSRLSELFLTPETGKHF